MLCTDQRAHNLFFVVFFVLLVALFDRRPQATAAKDYVADTATGAKDATVGAAVGAKDAAAGVVHETTGRVHETAEWLLETVRSMVSPVHPGSRPLSALLALRLSSWRLRLRLRSKKEARRLLNSKKGLAHLRAHKALLIRATEIPAPA